ncbi:uncharacterized protein BKA78DRAFT_302960 [Phyllosticta capitalensis]|uniref:uncharacterized protein n=1 Tax=Phyllosticta capitalensis TaxID=121624 RepID=UPI00312CE081
MTSTVNRTSLIPRVQSALTLAATHNPTSAAVHQALPYYLSPPCLLPQHHSFITHSHLHDHPRHRLCA